MWQEWGRHGWDLPQGTAIDIALKDQTTFAGDWQSAGAGCLLSARYNAKCFTCTVSFSLSLHEGPWIYHLHTGLRDWVTVYACGSSEAKVSQASPAPTEHWAMLFSTQNQGSRHKLDSVRVSRNSPCLATAGSSVWLVNRAWRHRQRLDPVFRRHYKISSIHL